MSDPNDQKPTWKMTAKLPLLLLGIGAILLGWFLSLRGTMRAAVVGGLLIAGGISAVLWSESIHNWCVPNDMKWGNMPFGQMRFHNGPPQLQDCVALVGWAKPVTSISAGELQRKMQAAKAAHDAAAKR